MVNAQLPMIISNYWDNYAHQLLSACPRAHRQPVAPVPPVALLVAVVSLHLHAWHPGWLLLKCWGPLLIPPHWYGPVLVPATRTRAEIRQS